MAGSQLYIYADRADLALLFEAFDRHAPLAYTETLSALNHDSRQFTSAAALLEFAVDHARPMRTSIFLIAPAGLPLRPREVRMRDGSGYKQHFEETFNPEAIDIVVGGEAGPATLVVTKLRTNGETQAARSLFQGLKKIVTARATRIDGAWVMPGALEKFDAGWRLTPHVEYASSQDLARPSKQQERSEPAASAEARRPRRSFEASVAVLREMGLVADTGQVRIPDAMPRHDDDAPCGVGMFRMGVEDRDLSALDLPRSFLARAQVVQCDFSDTNLTESNLCWSEFTDVDFSHADLRSADLRNAVFERADFSHADLSQADLRHADLRDCRFIGATMTGARVGTALRPRLLLNVGQHAAIDWREDEGEEAPGG